MLEGFSNNQIAVDTIKRVKNNRHRNSLRSAHKSKQSHSIAYMAFSERSLDKKATYTSDPVLEDQTRTQPFGEQLNTKQIYFNSS